MIELMVAYHNKYRSLLRPYKSRRNVESYKEQLQIFIDKSKDLFDFSSCKCYSFSTCSCPKQMKIPVLEQMFLTDQRNERKMIIGNVDKEATKV